MFRPYRHDNVDAKYRKVMLPVFNKLVWAVIDEVPDMVRRELGEEYTVNILGTGDQPFVPWKDVCTETKRILLARRSGYIESNKSEEEECYSMSNTVSNTVVKAEKMYLKVTKTLLEETQDLLVSIEVMPDNSFIYKKIIFWQQDQETGKEAWVIMPLGENPQYEVSMEEEITAQIKAVRSGSPRATVDETKEYQRLLSYTRKKWLLQDY